MRKFSALLLLTILAACGADEDDRFRICADGETADNGCGTCSCVDGAWSCPREECPDLVEKAGFLEIEPVVYSLNQGPDTAGYVSSRARLWYVFQPADESPEDAPLVVLFNGGPGATTSGLLFSYNTARRSLDPEYNGGLPVGDNPHAWTRLANLLYLDARGTGFSYGLMNEPGDPAARQAEFTVRNFNCFLDGADFVRAILRFLDRHPAIRGNPVFLSGESYAGVRATVILHLLLNHEEYASDQSIFTDLALVGEIRAHFESLHPELVGEAIPPGVVAGQFARQILIQPLLSGRNETAARGILWEQPNSVIFQIAAEEGLTFVPCAEQGPDCNPVGNALDFVVQQAGRDAYNYVESGEWTMEVTETASANLVIAEHLSEATGIEVSTLTELTAAGRAGAYRIGDPAQLAVPLPPSGDLRRVLGELGEGDAYYTFLNEFVSLGFRSDEAFRFGIFPGSQRFGAMFLQNLAHVETFVTHAAHDLMTYAPGQPQALAMHDTILAGCQNDATPRPGVDRAGWMQLDYLPDALGIEGLDQRTVRFPLYESSGHVVAINQPAELLEDVEAWLAGLDGS